MEFTEKLKKFDNNIHLYGTLSRKTNQKQATA